VRHVVEVECEALRGHAQPFSDRAEGNPAVECGNCERGCEIEDERTDRPGDQSLFQKPELRGWRSNFEQPLAQQLALPTP
jgi:hypothetical protein